MRLWISVAILSLLGAIVPSSSLPVQEALDLALRKARLRRSTNELLKTLGIDHRVPRSRLDIDALLDRIRGDRRREQTKSISEAANILLDFQRGLNTVLDVLANDRDANAIIGATLESTCDSVFEVECDPAAPYRTADGSCNNLQHPTWGMAGTAQRRLLQPNYGHDDAPRTLGSDERPLPNPRTVSVRLHRNGETTSKLSEKITLNAFQMGQFLDHDVILTPLEGGEGDNALECCDPAGGSERILLPDPNSMGDPFFEDGTCLNFARSAAALPEDCRLGKQRLQQNGITSFIDASNVYGSSDAEIADLREEGSAKLRTSRTNFLPTETHTPLPCLSGRGNTCYKAGDERVNVVPTLATYHTIWMREHNRVVDQLQPFFSDTETLFQEARKVVIGEMQHIIYNEYLSTFLTDDTQNDLKLLPEFAHEYDATLDPSFSSEAGIAYRMGHTWIPQQMGQYSTNYRQLRGRLFNTSNTFFSPDMTYSFGIRVSLNGLSALSRFLTAVASPETDQQMEKSVTDELFLVKDPTTGKSSSFDLAALNIQRGRDHGIPTYNQMRSFCGLSVATATNYSSHSTTNAEILNELYASPDDIDLWTGGLTEEGEGPDDALGPLFNCILGREFQRLKFGDRFYYSGEAVGFNSAQLEEIRKATMARILCDNDLGIDKIQPSAMRLQGTNNNDVVPCGEIPTVDLSVWGQETDLERSLENGKDAQRRKLVETLEEILELEEILSKDKYTEG